MRAGRRVWRGGELLRGLEDAGGRIPVWVAYVLAAAAAAAGVLSSAALAELGSSTIFAPSIAAVTVAIWLLGPGPAVALVAMLSVLTPLALDPRGSFDLTGSGDLLGLVLFVGAATVIVLLGTALRRARERMRAVAMRSEFLAEASLALESPASVEERLEELTRLAVPRLGDWCAIDLAEPRGGHTLAAVAHVDPERVAWARTLRQRFPPDPDAPTGVPHVLRTGLSEFYPVVTEEMIQAAAESPEHLAVIREVGFTSAAVAPLMARGRVLGALTLVTAESGRRLTEDDLHLTEELARRAGLALDLASLYRDEVEASARLTRLQRVTAALARALTHQEVADAVIREGRNAFGADGVVVALARAGRLNVLASSGYPPEALAHFEEIPLDAALPGTDCIRHGEVVALGTEADLLARYPALEGRPDAHHALLAAPLVMDGGAGGFLGFSFLDERAFDDDDVAFAVTLAQVAAGALARAALYETEHEIAKTLQRSLLPRRLPEVPGLDVATRYRPLMGGSEVGGDFFDLFRAGPDLVAVIGDVCGKGVEAASLTALARHSLRILAGSGRTPAAALAGLNDAIIAERGLQSLFLTAALTTLREQGDGWAVTVSCAGHPLPVVLGADGSVRTVGAPGPLLGPFADVALTDAHDRLRPGESLVLYTDGVTEARRRRDMFGDARLAAVLTGAAGGDAEAIARAVEEAAVRYHDGPLSDDLALVVVRVPAPADAGTGTVAAERAA